MFTIQFTKQAIKALRRISADEAALIRTKIRELALDPFAAPNVKKLPGRPGFRLRVGVWRVIYEVHGDELLIAILKIAPRGGAYQ